MSYFGFTAHKSWSTHGQGAYGVPRGFLGLVEVINLRIKTFYLGAEERRALFFTNLIFFFQFVGEKMVFFRLVTKNTLPRFRSFCVFGIRNYRTLKPKTQLQDLCSFQQNWQLGLIERPKTQCRSYKRENEKEEKRKEIRRKRRRKKRRRKEKGKEGERRRRKRKKKEKEDKGK